MQFLEITLATETTINSLPFEPASLPSTSASDHSLFDSNCSDSIINLDVSSPETSQQNCSDSIINLDVSSPETSQQSTTSKLTHNEPISASYLFSSNTVASNANSSSVSKNKRKRFNSTENEKKIQESLLEALCYPLKQPDAIDGILLRLGEGLRRLPYRERTQLEIQWLRELMAVEERCSNN
ncbi:uncharacterized protein LOC109863475 [Pseudomyrmex gracilis]|uniref:uncharacterized protein LOC109863475 n=1 Tax=Pseudomyrmex gracilis TaxID=219809 RepID=UPI00099524C5|nr:uncharacterized protein LOC109863475 [Pseudomyrmex gracilis]